jgi:hypothetical protein
VIDDPATGVRLVSARVPGVRDVRRRRGVPLEPVPVGEPSCTGSRSTTPAAVWLPSALWTISFAAVPAEPVLARPAGDAEKRLATDEVEEPEDLAVPIAQ